MTSGAAQRGFGIEGASRGRRVTARQLVGGEAAVPQVGEIPCHGCGQAAIERRDGGGIGNAGSREPAGRQRERLRVVVVEVESVRRRVGQQSKRLQRLRAGASVDGPCERLAGAGDVGHQGQGRRGEVTQNLHAFILAHRYPPAMIGGRGIETWRRKERWPAESTARGDLVRGELEARQGVAPRG